jgi:hypothetical protein
MDKQVVHKQIESGGLWRSSVACGDRSLAYLQSKTWRRVTCKRCLKTRAKK